jgi:hypothetical protein
MALKITNGRQYHHALSWPAVCFHVRGAEKHCARGSYGLNTRRSWYGQPPVRKKFTSRYCGGALLETKAAIRTPGVRGLTPRTKCCPGISTHGHAVRSRH